MKKITFRKSRIEGQGLFADEDIKKGELIAYIKGKVFVKKNNSIKDVFDNPDWVGISRNSWIDPAIPFKYLNHSCEPSAAIRGRVSLIAITNIKKGDEITFDYSTTEVDERWSLPTRCRCGNSKCRGTITSIQKLSRKTIERYLPNIPTRIKNIYFRESQ